MSKNPYKPWLIYTVVLFCLGLTERFTFPENGQLDGFVDGMILAVGCIGAIACWFFSYRALNAPPTDMLKRNAQIAVTWVLGPLAGVTAAILPAVDIDGGLLLFYPPVLGLFLTTFALPVLFFLRHRKFQQKRVLPSEKNQG